MKGDSSSAVDASKKLKKELDELDKAAKEAGTPMQQLGAAAGLNAEQYRSLTTSLSTAAVGFTAIAAGLAIQIGLAVKAVTGLYDLAKSASEAGSKIKDMQDKTGLAAVTLSTLKLAADNSGSSFDQVGDGVTKFAKLIGQANEGNEKAIASLKALGVSNTDLDGGLKEVIKTIANATDGTEQITLAQKAFGRSGADLIPVIKQINGDLEAAEEEAERLGTTLSEEDIRAADMFGDTLGVLSSQVETAAQRFALQFAPEITKAMASVSRFLSENQEVARVWGNTIADVIRAAAAVWSFGSGMITGALDMLGIKFASSASQARFWAEAILLAINPVLALAARVGAMFGAATPKQGQEFAQEMKMPSFSPRMPGGGGGGRGGGGKSAADKARDEAEKADREAFRARTDELRRMLANYEAVSNRIIAKASLDLAQGLIDETKFADLKMAVAERIGSYKLSLLEKELEAAQEHNQKTLDIEARIAVQKENNKALEYSNEAKQLEDLDKLREANEKKYTDIVKKAIAVREGLEKKGVEEFRKSEKAKFDLAIKNKEDVLQNIVDVTKFLYQSYQDDYDNKVVAAAADRDRRLAEIEELKLDEIRKREAIAEINRTYDAEALAAKQELNEKLAEVDEEYTVPADGGADAKTGPFQDLIEGWQNFYDTITATAPTIMETMQAVGGVMVKAFSQVANAIGSVVQQWVLYGKTGPAVMRQVLASALAAIAAEATVRAIYALAMGFFFLATHQYTDATNAFIAAAVFGSIGIGAALAGRAIAGNSFQQQTSTATGQTSSGRSSGQGDGNAGGVYSSQEDVVVENGRNRPAIRVDIGLKLDSNGVLQVIRDSVRSNGLMRDLILDEG